MSESISPPADREVLRVQHDTIIIDCVRCDPVDADALADWCDSVLGRDYFFKRRHIVSILERRNNFVYSIVADGVCSGLLMLYDGSILHNLYISPELRHSGVGTAVLEHFRPRRIRSKTNMLAGDPTPFYQKNGYVVDQPDPLKPHILDMVLPQGSPHLATGGPDNAHVNGAAKPSCSPLPAGRRAVGVLTTSVASAAPSVKVATPTPPIPPDAPGLRPPLGDCNTVTLSVLEYNALVKLKQNRDRIKRYRLKRKAEAGDPKALEAYNALCGVSASSPFNSFAGVIDPADSQLITDRD